MSFELESIETFLSSENKAYEKNSLYIFSKLKKLPKSSAIVEQILSIIIVKIVFIYSHDSLDNVGDVKIKKTIQVISITCF